MTQKYFFPFFMILSMLISITSKGQVTPNFSEYPTPTDADLWVRYKPEATTFSIWSPVAEEVKLRLYKTGNGGSALSTSDFQKGENGIWKITVRGDIQGIYYTYQVKTDGVWLNETPGIYAQALGVNGERAMIIDLKSTDPADWEKDRGPSINFPNEAILYELHVRDASIHPESGILYKGKYLGLAEKGSKGPNGVGTGLDHLKELGITHVHLLPTCDYNSVDESKLDKPQFNWGYDPINYNIPEGSYSTNPYRGEVRIQEFKEMVQAFHQQDIGVVIDVVYNHTGVYDNSNFNLEVPGYYYRQWENGKRSDASACGNETASDRAMMRKFIIESVAYWATEYHIDGFRFDLMAIHDIETMNAITKRLKEINPNILIYGEGWTAGDSPLPITNRALKAHTAQMPQVAAFSDEIRDGLKGSVFDDKDKGFVSGKKGAEESVKMGIAGCISHPQVNYTTVYNSDKPWAAEPWQSVNYVSCHDNLALFDKLKISRPDASQADLIAMDKLANAVVLTSQGIPFIHAGEEMLRTKKGNHNSYNAPDSINQIDWRWKSENKNVVDYYKNLIQLRKNHPAFYMSKKEDVLKNLVFQKVEDGLISFQISNHANGDKWKNILVIYNARPEIVKYKIKEDWKLAVWGDEFNMNTPTTGEIKVPAISMVVLYQE
ncbi:MAG TPA: type I pullulanase [Saprospiraceae bacterium]|nr:type I pullulanase [Saprospiraceae bacterium]